jgi:hypothetical protein
MSIRTPHPEVFEEVVSRAQAMVENSYTNVILPSVAWEVAYVQVHREMVNFTRSFFSSEISDTVKDRYSGGS